MKILCPNSECRSSEKTLPGNVIRFGFYPTRWRKRGRYRCQKCETMFCSNTGTPYYRLQHRRATFDQVANLSVEGLNKSAIARVEGIGWNAVDRCLEKASNRGAIGRKTAAIRGFLRAEHIVYRTAEPDDPARLRISMPEDDM